MPAPQMTPAQVEAARLWIEKKIGDLEYVPPESRAPRVRMLLEQALTMGFDYAIQVVRGEVRR